MARLYPFMPLMPGESVTSFAARLAALHGMLSVRTFFRYLGLRYMPIVAGDPAAMDQLADLTAVPGEDLAYHSLRRQRGTYSFRDEMLPQTMLRRSRAFVCPRCLAKDLARSSLPREAACYDRMIWHFSPIRACPDHNVLLEPVGECGHPSVAHDFARAIWPFLHDLDQRASAAKVVAPSAAEAYLTARLDQRHRPSPLLDRMPWYAAARTIETVGAAAMFGPAIRFGGLDDSERRRAADVGFEIIDGGEPAVQTFLDQILRGFAPSGTRDGAPAIYGQLHVLLSHPTPDPSYAPLRKIVFQHATAAVPYGPGAVVVGLPVKRRRLHSLVTAAAQVGQHPTRLRKLLIAEELIPADAPDRDSHVLFDASRAAPFLRRIAKGLKLRGVMQHLQTRYAHTLTLARHGFIQPITLPGAGQKGALATYAAADLEDFIASLVADAVVHPRPEPPIMDIPRAAKRAYCTTPDVLRMILKGELGWVGLDPDVAGFHAILVNADEVLSRVRGPDHDGYTMRTLRIRMGVHQRVIEALIAGGHLPQVRRLNPVNRHPDWIVMPETVDAFERRYVSLWELSRRWETNAFKLKKQLDRRGIVPAMRNDQVGATFYLRCRML